MAGEPELLELRLRMYEALKRLGAPGDVLEYVLETGDFPLVADDGSFVWHGRNGVTLVRTEDRWVVVLAREHGCDRVRAGRTFKT